MTNSLITERRGFGGTQQSRLSKHKSFGWTFLIQWRAARVKEISCYTLGCIWCSVSTWVGSYFGIFFHHCFWRLTWILKNRVSLLLLMPHFLPHRVLELLKAAERSHGDTHAPSAMASSCSSSSAPAARFCSLEKKETSLARAVVGIKFAASLGAAWGLEEDEACI